MWLAILAAVFSSGASSVGKVLQRKGTKSLPQFSADLQTIRKYLTNKTWGLGLLSDLSGSVFMVSALANAPVSVIQPVAGGGLIFLSLLSHFFFNEKLKYGEWLAVALCFCGIVGVGIATTSIDTGDHQASVPRLVVSLVLIFGLLLYGIRRVAKTNQRQRPKYFPAMCAFFAGCFFSLSSTTCRSGFVVGEITGKRLLFGAMGMGLSIMNTSIGFIYQTLGLKEGNAVMISTITTVTTIIIGMFLGIVALGESLPASRPTFLLHTGSCGLITIGSLALGNGGWGFNLSFLDKLLRSKRVSNMLPNKVRFLLQRYVSSATKLPLYNASQDSKSAN
jgi:drug/metabolite transporter (DMT)-like permease